MRPDEKKIATPAKVAAAMLVIGVLTWSWDYYDLMRIVVCASAAYVAWFGHVRKYESLFWVMLVCAIIYNPFAPIHINHSAWVVISLISAAAFWVVATDPNRFNKPGK